MTFQPKGEWMLHEKQWLSDLYKVLQPFEEHSFPKECPKCGKVYVSLLDLICQSYNTVRSSGLAVVKGEETKPIIGLFRNCTCGTTLFVFCKNRRDVSEQGIRRRETFDQLLKMFEAAGVDALVARQELLKILRGEESELLRQYRESGLGSKLPSGLKPRDAGQS